MKTVVCKLKKRNKTKQKNQNEELPHVLQDKKKIKKMSSLLLSGRHTYPDDFKTNMYQCSSRN